MRGRGKNGGEDDGRGHDHDKEYGDEQAAEVGLDRFDGAAHGDENNKAGSAEKSGLGPIREACRPAAVKGR